MLTLFKETARCSIGKLAFMYSFEVVPIMSKKGSSLISTNQNEASVTAMQLRVLMESSGCYNNITHFKAFSTIVVSI
jgi:hypothetical protein